MYLKKIIAEYGQAITHKSITYLFPVVVSISMVGISNTQAQPVTSSEYQIKAAFLYKFGSYIEWPEDTFATLESPLTIGVLGADGLADSLEEIIAGRTVNNRKIIVSKLSLGAPIAGLQILFIGNSEKENLPSILAEAQKFPVLTVTESEESLTLGGIINFVVMGDKVRFDIALGSADRNNLKISSRLLEVARRVIKGST